MPYVLLHVKGFAIIRFLFCNYMLALMDIKSLHIFIYFFFIHIVYSKPIDNER